MSEQRQVTPRQGSRVAAVLICVGTAVLLTGCQAAPHRTTPPDPNSTTPGQPLVPDQNGRIDRSTTGTTGIGGRWVARADSEDCQRGGKHELDACSRFISPDPHAPTLR